MYHNIVCTIIGVFVDYKLVSNYYEKCRKMQNMYMSHYRYMELIKQLMEKIVLSVLAKFFFLRASSSFSMKLMYLRYYIAEYEGALSLDMVTFILEVGYRIFFQNLFAVP